MKIREKKRKEQWKEGKKQRNIRIVQTVYY